MRFESDRREGKVVVVEPFRNVLCRVGPLLRKCVCHRVPCDSIGLLILWRCRRLINSDLKLSVWAVLLYSNEKTPNCNDEKRRVE